MFSRIRSSRKAQSAIEFLMTYGWAFMTIFLMVGALFYFGILDVSKLLPEKCEFASEFQCSAFTLVEDTDVGTQDGMLKFKLVNNLGVGIELLNCSVVLANYEKANFCLDDDAEFKDVPGGPYNCGAGAPDVDPDDQIQAGEMWNPGEEKIFYFSECDTSGYGMTPGSKHEILMTFEYKAQKSVYRHNVTGRIVAAVDKRAE